MRGTPIYRGPRREVWKFHQEMRGDQLWLFWILECGHKIQRAAIGGNAVRSKTKHKCMPCSACVMDEANKLYGKPKSTSPQFMSIRVAKGRGL